ncbi:MFS transporter [Aneurinibacillus sp. Ricciae_BoGa-3]|uniref:MFS transporter n=1 Tax=Aneurinibacillus sp. Ricciae_BoGa-3 TaxID=3022697 RepID=UPI002341603F|nr:MFS transporter [Aneurinibacillus sp. Ricciae_BoGa-3]WCK54096.1 MFS transporter [Aneurinibacillus sp. Ricciae_BoGa-3]
MMKLLSLLFLIMFLIGTDTFLISPLLPMLREGFHITAEASGWMVGAYAIGYAVSALISGPLSDGWNRKKVMAYGMLGFTVFTFLCGLATGFWSIFLFRALAGICAACAAPQVWATIPAIVPPQKIIKSMGIVTAGLAVSQTVGVPIGTYLAIRSWSTPFFIIAAFSLILVLLIVSFVPNIPPAAQDKKHSLLERYETLLKERKARRTFLAYFIFQTGNFAAFTFLGNWLADKFTMRVDEIGSVLVFLGLGNIIGSFYGSMAVKKIGQHASLVIGIISITILYPVISYAPSVVYVKIVYFIIFLITGTIFPVMMALLQSLSPTARGTIAALSSALMYGATTVGAYLAGLFYGHFSGFTSVCLFTAVCYLISTFLWVKSTVLTAEPLQAKIKENSNVQ